MKRSMEKSTWCELSTQKGGSSGQVNVNYSSLQALNRRGRNSSIDHIILLVFHRILNKKGNQILPFDDPFLLYMMPRIPARASPGKVFIAVSFQLAVMSWASLLWPVASGSLPAMLSVPYSSVSGFIASAQIMKGVR